ncbi:MAG: hypothetical protein IKV55_06890, partial [Oscillospiraceae bacterium]|nr:hypothetical protein [Oscillospiraceae bacterium]
MSGLADIGATYGNTDFGTLWVVLCGLMKVLGNVWIFLPLLIGIFVLACFLLKPKKEAEAK